MWKTTIYLPDELRSALARASKAKHRSQAALIREAVEEAMKVEYVPELRLPLFSSGLPTLAEHVDEALVGFGES